MNNASAGTLQIQTLPVYAGGDDVQLLNDIKGGSGAQGAVAGGAVSTAVWTTAKIPSFVALQMPFLIDNYPLEQRVISNSSGIAQRMLKQATAGTGLVPLTIFEGGMRQFALVNKDVNSVADLEGLKLRTPPGDPINASLAALGASPTPIAIGQVFQALQSGTVDGMEANSALVNTLPALQRRDQAHHHREPVALPGRRRDEPGRVQQPDARPAADPEERGAGPARVLDLGRLDRGRRRTTSRARSAPGESGTTRCPPRAARP